MVTDMIIFPVENNSQLKKKIKCAKCTNEFLMLNCIHTDAHTYTHTHIYSIISLFKAKYKFNNILQLFIQAIIMQCWFMALLRTAMWTLHCYEYKYLASGWEFIVWNFVFGFDIKFVFYALICNNPWIVGVYTFLNCLKNFW